MKKSIVTLVSLLVVAIMAGCVTQTTEMENSFVDDVTEIAGAGNSDFIITEHRPPIAHGSSEAVVVDVNALSFFDETTSLPTTFPVFVNGFPFGQGGPLFHIDEGIIERSQKNIEGFLRIFYGRDDVSDLTTEHEHDGHIFYNRFGDTAIMSGPVHVSLQSSEHGLVDSIINGNLLENRLVQYALEYMGIKNPEVTTRITFDSVSGEPDIYEYTITEATDDFFEGVINTNFSSVRATHFGGSDSAHILMLKQDISSLRSNEPIVPFEIAMEYVMVTYGIEDRYRINATINYASDVEVGYFVPVYTFYIEIEKAGITSDGSGVGGNMYNIVLIPMPQTFHLDYMERRSEQEN